ncbi:MAG: DNA alkylation repair protein, partial [Myxococcales bacterium]|nr:DNA alkylation repair protein [Myxococcales bacterium]
AASEIVIASLGPPLQQTEGNGLRVFFFLPHASFIATSGSAHFDAGMAANYELTRRFTAEFSIRPFIERHQRRTLARLKKWTRDADPHVRRLCSEGTRPRLPWASRLPALQADPSLALPILEALKDDPELYVRRSVANHLGDICKDHPEWTFALCERWIDEVVDAPAERRKQRHWLVRHAVRLPAKKKVARALRLREQASP